MTDQEEFNDLVEYRYNPLPKKWEPAQTGRDARILEVKATMVKNGEV